MKLSVYIFVILTSILYSSERRTALGAVVAYVPGSGVYYSPANGNYPIYGNALNYRRIGDSSIVGVDNSYETRTTNGYTNGNIDNSFGTGFAGNPSISSNRGSYSPVPPGDGGSYSQQAAGVYGPGNGNYGYANAGIPSTSNTGASGVRGSYYPVAVSTYVPGNANYGNAYGTGVNYRTAESSPISGNGGYYSPPTGGVYGSGNGNYGYRNTYVSDLTYGTTGNGVSGTYGAAAESANKPGAASVSAGVYNDVASVARNSLLSAHNSEAVDPIAHVPGSVLGLYLSDDSTGTNTGYSPGNSEITRSYYL